MGGLGSDVVETADAVIITDAPVAAAMWLLENPLNCLAKYHSPWFVKGIHCFWVF